MHARKAGKPIASLPSKLVAFAETKARRENSVRLEILEEVHRAWCHCKSDRDFTAWLQAQIKQLKGKAAS